MNTQTASTAQSRHAVPRVPEADSRFSRIYRGLLASLGVAAFLLVSAPAVAQLAPDLGTLQRFGAFGGAGVTGAAGAGVIVDGDVGSSPTPTIINFPPSSVAPPFVLHLANDAVVQQARTDAGAAALNLASQGPGLVLGPQLNAQTLTSGIYSFAAQADLAALGTLTLNGPGVFVFIVNSALTANVGSNVVGTASPCNVFWLVGSDATLNGNSFLGTVIAATGFVTVGASANVTGRVVANTAVTMAGAGGNTVGGCSDPAAPLLGKAFSPASINTGGISTLTITLSNPNLADATLTAPLIDTLPGGVVIAATPNAATTCTGAGAPVAVAGGATVTLPAGRSIPATGSCTLTVDVTAAVAGSYINTLLPGALVTSNGSNLAPAVATLTVVSPGLPPTLGKAFGPATINAGSVSTLILILSNPNAAVATLTAPLIDTLPSGVVIAATPIVGTTCGGVGAPVANAGGSTVLLPAGRSIPANGSCTLTVDVTATLGGSYINSVPAGALVTSNGNNAAPAVATLTVIPPIARPLLSKAFSPASINAGGVSTLTVTLSNPRLLVATLTASLIDTLPGGVVIAATPNVGTTCGGTGAPAAVAGSSTVTLPAGRSIPANGSCTLTVDVTAAAGGSYINTLPAGALVTSNGSNALPAIATLTVVSPGSPPTLGKAFSPATINAGGVSTLTVILSNPNPAVATLTAPLVDTLPSGVVIAPTPNAATTCTGAGTPVAVAGSSTVTLPAGRSIPANGSCTLTVDVTAAIGGSYINTLPAGALVTSNGNNAGPGVATLTVIPPLAAPPLLGKAFNPTTIFAGGVSTLTVTLSNPAVTDATLTASLIDTLPGGVVIAATPNVSTTCGGVGAPVAVAGQSTVTLPAGRSIPATGSCTLTVDVTAAVAGTYINTLPAGALVTSNGNNAAPAVATLTVVALPVPPTPLTNIPTLSEWGMIILAGLLALFGLVAVRRQAG